MSLRARKAGSKSPMSFSPLPSPTSTRMTDENEVPSSEISSKSYRQAWSARKKKAGAPTLTESKTPPHANALSVQRSAASTPQPVTRPALSIPEDSPADGQGAPLTPIERPSSPALLDPSVSTASSLLTTSLTTLTSSLAASRIAPLDTPGDVTIIGDMTPLPPAASTPSAPLSLTGGLPRGAHLTPGHGAQVDTPQYTPRSEATTELEAAADAAVMDLIDHAAYASTAPSVQPTPRELPSSHSGTPTLVPRSPAPLPPSTPGAYPLPASHAGISPGAAPLSALKLASPAAVAAPVPSQSVIDLELLQEENRRLQDDLERSLAEQELIERKMRLLKETLAQAAGEARRDVLRVLSDCDRLTAELQSKDAELQSLRSKMQVLQGELEAAVEAARQEAERQQRDTPTTADQGCDAAFSFQTAEFGAQAAPTPLHQGIQAVPTPRAMGVQAVVTPREMGVQAGAALPTPRDTGTQMTPRALEASPVPTAAAVPATPAAAAAAGTPVNQLRTQLRDLQARYECAVSAMHAKSVFLATLGQRMVALHDTLDSEKERAVDLETQAELLRDKVALLERQRQEAEDRAAKYMRQIREDAPRLYQIVDLHRDNIALQDRCTALERENLRLREKAAHATPAHLDKVRLLQEENEALRSTLKQLWTRLGMDPVDRAAAQRESPIVFPAIREAPSPMRAMAEVSVADPEGGAEGDRVYMPEEASVQLEERPEGEEAEEDEEEVTVTDEHEISMVSPISATSSQARQVWGTHRPSLSPLGPSRFAKNDALSPASTASSLSLRVGEGTAHASRKPAPITHFGSNKGMHTHTTASDRKASQYGEDGAENSPPPAWENTDVTPPPGRKVGDLARAALERNRLRGRFSPSPTPPLKYRPEDVGSEYHPTPRQYPGGAPLPSPSPSPLPYPSPAARAPSPLPYRSTEEFTYQAVKRREETKTTAENRRRRRDARKKEEGLGQKIVSAVAGGVGFAALLGIGILRGAGRN